VRVLCTFEKNVTCWFGPVICASWRHKCY